MTIVPTSTPDRILSIVKAESGLMIEERTRTREIMRAKVRREEAIRTISSPIDIDARESLATLFEVVASRTGRLCLCGWPSPLEVGPGSIPQPAIKLSNPVSSCPSRAANILCGPTAKLSQSSFVSSSSRSSPGGFLKKVRSVVGEGSQSIGSGSYCS